MHGGLELRAKQLKGYAGRQEVERLGRILSNCHRLAFHMHQQFCRHGSAGRVKIRQELENEFRGKVSDNVLTECLSILDALLLEIESLPAHKRDGCCKNLRGALFEWLVWHIVSNRYSPTECLLECTVLVNGQPVRYRYLGQQGRTDTKESVDVGGLNSQDGSGELHECKAGHVPLESCEFLLLLNQVLRRNGFVRVTVGIVSWADEATLHKLFTKRAHATPGDMVAVFSGLKGLAILAV